MSRKGNGRSRWIIFEWSAGFDSSVFVYVLFLVSYFALRSECLSRSAISQRSSVDAVSLDIQFTCMYLSILSNQYDSSQVVQVC